MIVALLICYLNKSMFLSLFLLGSKIFNTLRKKARCVNSKAVSAIRLLKMANYIQSIQVHMPTRKLLSLTFIVRSYM